MRPLLSQEQLSKGLKYIGLKNGSSQGQNLALTGLCVPYLEQIILFVAYVFQVHSTAV